MAAKKDKVRDLAIAVDDKLEEQSARINSAFNRTREVDAKLRSRLNDAEQQLIAIKGEADACRVAVVILSGFLLLTQVVPGAIYWVPRVGRAVFCDAPLFQTNGEKAATREQVKRLSYRVDAIQQCYRYGDTNAATNWFFDTWNFQNGDVWIRYESDGSTYVKKNGSNEWQWSGLFTKDCVAQSAYAYADNLRRK